MEELKKQSAVNTIKSMMRQFGLSIEDLGKKGAIKQSSIDLTNDVMSQLGISIKDLEEIKSHDEMAFEILTNRKPVVVQQTAKPVENLRLKYEICDLTGLKYVTYDGELVGVCIEGGKKVRPFIFSFKEDTNLDIHQGTQAASRLNKFEGKSWYIPCDEHFLSIKNKVHSLNKLFARLGKPRIGQYGYLSSTSQANRPDRWKVRYVVDI